MIRSILSLSFMVFASVSQAGLIGWKPVNETRLPEYKRVVQEYMSQASPKCTGTRVEADGVIAEQGEFSSQDFAGDIANASGAWIRTDQQPVLRMVKMSGVPKQAGTHRVAYLDFVSSEDFKSIIGITYQVVVTETKLTTLNLGTVIDPNYQQVMNSTVVTHRGSCQ